MEESSKPKRWCATVNGLLKVISLGKYETKLYNEGEASHSSSLGGIVTIICGLMIAFYAFVVLKTVFDMESFNIDEEARAIPTYYINSTT